MANNNSTNIDTELKERAIQDYLIEFETMNQKRRLKETAGTILLLIGILLIPRWLKTGDFYSSWVIDAIIGVSVVLLGIMAFIISVRMDKKEFLKEQRNVYFKLEEDSLVRYDVTDKRRRKHFKYNKIQGLRKDNNLISFEYGNRTVEFLDFYNPPLYDELINRISAQPKRA